MSDAEVVIAERAIYGTVGATETRVLVSLFAPEADDRGNWRCRFTFQTDSSEVQLKSGRGGGVDGVQALEQALYGVAYTLDKSGIEWFWWPQADDPGDEFLPRLDDGFPRPGLSAGANGAAFRKRMEAYVTKEREADLQARVDTKRAPSGSIADH